MKLLEGKQIKTYCNVCQKVLREDTQVNRVIRKVTLHQRVVHMGNGRHKCKGCYQKGIKSKWRYNMNPIKGVRVS